MADQTLTQEYLRRILDYDPMTGVFRWRYRDDVPKNWNTRFAGSVAGSRSAARRGVLINGKRYYAYRLAWFWMNGEWVPEIDHKNGISNDDRFENLRPARHSQNLCNARLRSDNTSGFKGVYWHKRSSRWLAQIVDKGEWVYLGAFDTAESAGAAYAAAAAQRFGEFMRIK